MFRGERRVHSNYGGKESSHEGILSKDSSMKGQSDADI